jgi:hypothetical protein
VKEIIMKLILFFFIISATLISCKFPDLNKTEDLSKRILDSIQKNEWDIIKENSSVSYWKKMNGVKFDQLKKWFNEEFGKLKNYKKLLLYSGSSFTIPGENYVKISYEISGTRGFGQMYMIFVIENGKLKILKIEFTKKPNI